MPDPQRATQIPHVYRDIFSDLHKREYPVDNWSIIPVRINELRLSETPEKGMQSVKVFVGGIIPAQDISELKGLGVAEVFLPGASTEDVARQIRMSVVSRSEGV